MSLAELLGFRKKANVDEAESFIVQTIQQSIREAVGDAENAIALSRDLVATKKELTDLQIEKAKIEESFATREREIEHKVGLERKRQEFEVGAAKREALVTVREENLKADRTRFEEQLKFHEDRFTGEVGYLKEILTEIMQRLPSAQQVEIVHKKGR